MNGKELFEAMTMIDDRFVEEAEHQIPLKTPVSLFTKLLPMAACLVLLLTVAARFHDSTQEPEFIPSQTVVSSDPSEPPSDPQQGPKPARDNQTDVAEVPSVILRVEELTDRGFIGTVAELVDTDLIPVGTVLNAVWAKDMLTEASLVDTEQHKSQNSDLVGSLISVQFVDYDSDTGTILVNLINRIEKGKDE